MTPEAKVKAKLLKWLVANMPDHWRVMPRGGPFGKGGVPDILICWRGLFIGIEVKADNGVVVPLQMMNLKLIQKAGGVAAVVRGYDINRLQEIKAICLSRLKTTAGPFMEG